MKYYRTILVSCFFCLAFSVTNEDQPFLWSNSKRIVWEDFKGKPDDRSNAVAITASGLSYDLSAQIIKGKVIADCKVGAYFYPQESWFRPEHADNHTLNHERLHFDITELMARKFRKRLAKATFTKNVKKEVKDIYHEVNKSLDSLQNAYDTETRYSIDAEKQMTWQVKIARELDATKDFEN